MIIRRAHPSDADGIARVHVTAWHESYRGIIPDDAIKAFSVEQRAAFWRGALAQSEALVHVAEADGAVCAFVSAGAARPGLPVPGEIYALYVLDAVKRRGIGRELFGRARNDLAAHGFASFGLWVLANNPPARKFYETMGGRADETRLDRKGKLALEELPYLWDSFV
jgi:ribosomal protein S18 acetylase RimI-like enzyme